MQALLSSRRTVIALTLATFNLATAPIARADQPSPDAIVGKWAADDGSVKLEMFRAGTEYQARFLYGRQVVEADGVTMKKDVNNPDPALRNRSLKNIVFATGLHYGNGEWTDGSIYDASSGRTYSCKAEMKGASCTSAAISGSPRWVRPPSCTAFPDPPSRSERCRRGVALVGCHGGPNNDWRRLHRAWRMSPMR